MKYYEYRILSGKLTYLSSTKTFPTVSSPQLLSQKSQFSSLQSAKMAEFYSHNDEEVELPPSVQQMINQICKKERQNSPDDTVRRLLVAIGEERSLYILNEISKCQIKKTLSGFIVFMAKKYYQSETQQFYQKQNHEQPVPSAESFYHSPQIRRNSLSSPNSSCSSVNFSPRNRPIFQDRGKVS